MTIFNPLGTTNEKFWQIAYTIDVQDANYITSMTGGGYYNDGGASAHSGVTFFPQSNNFNTGGKWKLYGIKA
jgi:hypothetical protein